MRFEKQSYIVNDYPSLKSDYWNKPVLELVDRLNYYNEASIDLRQNVWPQAMKAYLCRRELPEFESMELIDSSPYGESDIWEGINFLTDAIMNAQMPRDQSYLELLSYEAEDQGLLNDIRDLLMSIHRQADTRSQYAKHVKQTLIYGTSALWFRWQKLERLVRKGLLETVEMLRSQNPNADIEQLTALARKARFPEVKFNGPVIAPLDMYDVWIDPTCDMSRQHSYPLIVRYYMTPEEMKSAVDENGEKKYSNLDGLQGQTLGQIYAGQEERLDLMMEMGITPLANVNNKVQLVPVYCFHAPVQKFNGDSRTFVDTFFYVAQSATKEGWRIVRVEDSPYVNGSRGIYVDTYVDMINGGYGIGAIEKSLNAWHYKNLMSAIGLQQGVLAVAPMYSVITDALPEGGKVKLGPGAVTQTRGKYGHEFIAPIPVPFEKMQAGMNSEQWYGQKILSQMQAYGAINQDPTKTYKDEKTATQINVESTSGSVVRDNFLEKMVLRSLEPLMQDVYDSAREHLAAEEFVNFERTVDGASSIGKVPSQELNRKRKVQVTGYHGLVNRANEMKEMQEALQVLTTGNALQVLPQLLPVLQELILKILGRLGVKNIDKYKQDPVTMLLNDPNIAQKVMQVPQFQELVMGMAQQLTGAGGQNGPEFNAAGDSAGGPPVSSLGPAPRETYNAGDAAGAAIAPPSAYEGMG